MNSPDLAALAKERPAESVSVLIRDTMRAGTASVTLVSEATEQGAASGFDRVLQGVADFANGLARLVEVSTGEVQGPTTVVIGGILYRSQGEDTWECLSRNEGGRDNLTAEGFGLLSLARGANQLLEVRKAGDGLFLRFLVKHTPLFDDMSATDVLQVPTALLVEPLEARMSTDAAGRIVRFAIESTKRPRLAVQRRRFRLALSGFGVPVDITPPSPERVIQARKRRTLFGRVRRRIGYPAGA